MDEFMCPRTAPGHHEVHQEASCGPSCACIVDTTWVLSANTNYFNFAIYAPTVGGRWGCNPRPTGATLTNCARGTVGCGPQRAGWTPCDTTPVTGVMQQPNVSEASSTVNYYLPMGTAVQSEQPNTVVHTTVSTQQPKVSEMTTILEDRDVLVPIDISNSSLPTVTVNVGTTNTSGFGAYKSNLLNTVSCSVPTNGPHVVDCTLPILGRDYHLRGTPYQS